MAWLGGIAIPRTDRADAAVGQTGARPRTCRSAPCCASAAPCSGGARRRRHNLHLARVAEESLLSAVFLRTFVHWVAIPRSPTPTSARPVAPLLRAVRLAWLCAHKSGKHSAAGQARRRGSMRESQLQRDYPTCSVSRSPWPCAWSDLSVFDAKAGKRIGGGNLRLRAPTHPTRY